MTVEKKKTILLVEDEAIIALAEQEDLENLEYRVLTVYSGADAIHAYKDNDEIDLILMDIDLGKGIDGVQTAEIILEHREIPIVFLSESHGTQYSQKDRKNYFLWIHSERIENDGAGRIHKNGIQAV